MKEDLTFGNGIFAGIVIGSIIWIIILLIIFLSNPKFCPECGHRYMANKSYCECDGAELKDME